MAEPAPAEPEFLIVGHVTKAHGIKGELAIRPLTDRPEEVYAAGRRILLGDREGGVSPGSPALTVERARVHKQGLLVKFEEVPDRNAAERLAGRYLLVATGELAPAAEDEVFYHHLLGAEVVLEDGQPVGRVREVYETAPSDLLEVEAESGKRHLVPFTKAIVREVDVEARRIVIEPPEGLLEL
ncbi:MAG: ribosome maturation factor RimM [Gemmatimonadota bacterium]